MNRFGVRPEKERDLFLRMQKAGIREDDIEEKFIRSQGPGGQKLNKTATCVYLKHVPTGLEVKVQKERSQALNRFLARRLLLEKVENQLSSIPFARQEKAGKIRKQKNRRRRRLQKKMKENEFHAESEASKMNSDKAQVDQALWANAAKISELAAYQDHSIVSRQIISKPTGTVTLFAFDCGQSLSEHTAPFDALLQIIEGEAQVMTDGKWNAVKQGEMIVLPAGRRHAVRADERFKMLLVMIKSL